MEYTVLFTKFMTLYFWVYLVLLVTFIINEIQFRKEPIGRVAGPQFWNVVGLVLWFMSWSF